MLKKIIIWIAASVLITLIWVNGFERFYAHILAFLLNTMKAVFGGDANVGVTSDSGDLVFMVHTLIDGKKGFYPQKVQAILFPVIIVFSWFSVLFYVLPAKIAAKQSMINFGIFLFFQMVFMLLLTFYYTSSFARFLYHIFLESFYIIALFLVLKDCIEFPGIWMKGSRK
ncbi:MAG: hypothetical protein ABR597_00295 [Bacteroidales bacterium]